MATNQTQTVIATAKEILRFPNSICYTLRVGAANFVLEQTTWFLERTKARLNLAPSKPVAVFVETVTAEAEAPRINMRNFEQV